MGRHFTEPLIERTLAVFANDNGMTSFAMHATGVGADATAVRHGEPVYFEIKAAAARVIDASKPSGDRPGRFRVDPSQYPDTYGTEALWYALVVYEPTAFDAEGRATDGDIVDLNIVRSDQLPQRDTVISLSASRVAGGNGR